MSSPTPSAKDYDSRYLGWKNWGSAKPFGYLAGYEKAMFDAQLAKTNLKRIRNVLEIGFGNGGFLSYAKKKGWEITGAEMSQELLSAAKAAGINAIEAKEVTALPDGSFDLITAFDVFEHIPQDELPNFLKILKAKLRAGGVLLARFPNGDSPLGLPYQNGDFTHTNALGSNKVRYLAGVVNMEIVYLGGESVPLFSRCLPLFFYALISNPIKWMIEGFVRIVFFPKKRFFFASPNLVVALKNKD